MASAIILCNKIQLSDSLQPRELSLLHLSNRPLIEYNICALAHAHISEIYVITTDPASFQFYTQGLEKMYNVSICTMEDPNQVLQQYRSQKFIVFPGESFGSFEFGKYAATQQFSKVSGTEVYIGYGHQFLQEEKIAPYVFDRPKFYSSNRSLSEILQTNQYIMQNFDVESCKSPVSHHNKVQNSSIDIGVQMAKNVTIINSVVGKSVVFRSNSRVVNCLVEGEITIQEGECYQDSVLVKE